jgi:hypothetical protein
MKLNFPDIKTIFLFSYSINSLFNFSSRALDNLFFPMHLIPKNVVLWVGV